MKKVLVSVVLVALWAKCFAQQADMPVIIVFPDNNFMRDHGYYRDIDNDGSRMTIYNYKDAFEMNEEIGLAVQATQDVFEEHGFRHEDLQETLRNMDMESAVELARKSKGRGTESGIMEEILQQANPDIRIDLNYSVKPLGPRKNISFKLKAVDVYTREQIAFCDGTVEGTMDGVGLALRKIINGKSEEFCQKIINYFTDLRNNGRKITVVFRAGDGSGIDFLNDEVGPDDDIYSDFLLSCIRKHAVNRSASMGRQTDVICEFKNVRIPFFDQNGDPLTARSWAKGVIKAFKAEAGLKVKNDIGGGLGLVNFIIGIE